jgi:hypothetical protein
VAGSDIFRSVSQIPGQKKVMKIMAIEFIHHTRQLCKYELKIKLRKKRGRKYKLRKHG